MTSRLFAATKAILRAKPRAFSSILLAVGLAAPSSFAAEEGRSPPAPEAGTPADPGRGATAVAEAKSVSGSPKDEEATLVERRVEETLGPVTKEGLALDARLADAKAKEPAAVVRRFEELVALFVEYATHLRETVRAEVEAERLERQSFELAQKKERALHLLEQTETRRARAKLRVDELEAARSAGTLREPKSDGAKE